jgi:hypothetical protein
LTAGPARTRRPQLARGDDVGAGRLAEEDRDLAEEVAAGEGGPLLAVDDDVRLAVEDHVERGAGEALAEDPRPGREHLLLEHVGDPVELGRRQIREQGEPGDLVDDLVACGHRAPSPPASVCSASCQSRVIRIRPRRPIVRRCRDAVRMDGAVRRHH